MTITAYQQTRAGQLTTVTVSSDLDPLDGAITYYWYFDGTYLGHSASPSHTFCLREGDQGRAEVVDTQDPDFDPLTEGPAGWPSRRTVFWTASIDATVVSYRVDQQEGAGPWTTIAVVPHDPLRWSCTVLTGRLVDLVEYTFRVVPLDAAGNEGTPLAIGPEKVVRTPDAPDFTATLDPETAKVTFAEQP